MVAQLSCCCCHREPPNQTWQSRSCLKPILGSWELAAPVIFGEEAELAHVWVLLGCLGWTGSNFSSLYLSHGGAAAVPTRCPWEQIPVYTALGVPAGSSGAPLPSTPQACCCAFPALLTWGIRGTVGSLAVRHQLGQLGIAGLESSSGMSNSPWERLFLTLFWDQPTALTIPR